MDKLVAKIAIGFLVSLVVGVLVAYFLGRRSGRKKAAGGGDQQQPVNSSFLGGAWTVAKELSPWGRALKIGRVVFRVLIVVASIGSLIFLGNQVVQWDGWSRLRGGGLTCAEFWTDWWVVTEEEGWEIQKPNTTRCSPEAVSVLLGRLAGALMEKPTDWTTAAGVAESLELIGGFYPEGKSPEEFVRRLQGGVAIVPPSEEDTVVGPTAVPPDETPVLEYPPTPKPTPGYPPPTRSASPAPEVAVPQHDQTTVGGCPATAAPGTRCGGCYYTGGPPWCTTAGWVYKNTCTSCTPGGDAAVAAAVDDLLDQFRTPAPAQPTARPRTGRTPPPAAAATPLPPAATQTPAAPPPTPMPTTQPFVTPASPMQQCISDGQGGCKVPEWVNPTPTPTRLPPGPPLASPTPIPAGLPDGVLCSAVGPGGIDQCGRCKNGFHLSGGLYYCGPG